MRYTDMTAEQKKKRNRQNAASRQRYEAKAYNKVSFRIRQDGTDGLTADQIREAAELSGMSVNAWIIHTLKCGMGL